MPKLKTNKSAQKRFRFTKTGKVKRSSTGLRHKLSKKAPKRKRTLGGPTFVFEGDMNLVTRLMPYGGR
jgi:large subunit ribosomal protein L35